MLLDSLQPEQRPGVSLGDCAVEQRVLDGAGRLEQPQLVGDRYAALAHASPHLILGQAELVNQLGVGRRLLQGIQVRPLNIFHQRQLQDLARSRILDQDRNRGQARQPRRAPATLPGDELVASSHLRDDRWLDDAVFLDGCCKLNQVLLPNWRTGLAWIRSDRSDGDLRHSLLRRCRSFINRKQRI